MDIIPDKRKLVGLVKQSARGKLCLPNFQRDFVWKRDEVADLIRSILRGYFIGSLLLLRCDPDQPPFAPIALRGADPERTKLQPDALILDGQQRLTSLLYAFKAPDLGLKNSKSPRRFFIDLDVLMMDPDDDAIVFDRTPREMTRDGLDEQEGQWRTHKLPVTALMNEDGFLRWRDGIDDWLGDTDPGAHATFRAEWRKPWTEAVTHFQQFEVPVVELPRVNDDDVDEIARVCAIFEKLNSTGVDLSVYDLLTARLFRSKIDLHQLWDQAVEDHPLIAEWSEGSADNHKFGVLMLRTVALMRGLEPKPKMLINLDHKDFEVDWRRAASAFERALELVTHVGPDGFGVFNQKWLPGFGLLPVLAALRALIEDRRLGNEAREDLRRWYWSSVFLERYSSSVETRSRRDYQDLVRRWEGATVIPAAWSDAASRIGSPGYSVRESASYASSVYSGVFCLLAIGGARDWAAAESIELQNLEDHHIFPRSYLVKRGFDAKKDARLINSICNRTLISDSTNKVISDKAPGDYLEDKRVFPRDPELLLPAHFIRAEAQAVMADANGELSVDDAASTYEEFCRIREKAIVERIRDACGVEESDVVDEPDDDW